MYNLLLKMVAKRRNSSLRDGCKIRFWGPTFFNKVKKKGVEISSPYPRCEMGVGEGRASWQETKSLPLVRESKTLFINLLNLPNKIFECNNNNKMLSLSCK